MSNYSKSTRLTFWFFSVLIISGIIIPSCRLDITDPIKPSEKWKPNYLIPLAAGTMNIFDRLPAKLIQKNPTDKSLRVVFEQETPIGQLSDKITTTDYSKTGEYKADSFLSFPGSFKFSTSFATMLSSLNTPCLDKNNCIGICEGCKYPVPAMGPNAIEAGWQEMKDSSGQQFMDFIIFKKGNFNWAVDNRLPVDLGTMQFELYDSTETNSDSVFLNGTMLNIKANSTKDTTIDLTDRMIKGKFKVRIKYYSPGSEPDSVPITTGQTVESTFLMTDLAAKSGRALIPKKQFPKEKVLEFSATQTGGIRLKTLRLDEGTLSMTITNFFKMPITANFVFPPITEIVTGATLELPFKLPAYDPSKGDSNQHTITNARKLKGYIFDFRGPGDTSYNKLSYKGDITINSEGTKMVNFDIADYVSFKLELADMHPVYASGYFGSQKLPFTQKVNLPDTALFSSITAGSFGLDSVSLNFKFENPVGMKIDFVLNRLFSTNAKTGEEKFLRKLDGTVVNSLGTDTLKIGSILPAIDINPGVKYEITKSQFGINKSNSKGLEDILTNFPKALSFNITSFANPYLDKDDSAAQSNQMSNFVYTNSVLNGKVSMEFPLALSMNGLTIEKTMPFTFGKDKSGTAKSISTDSLFSVGETNVSIVGSVMRLGIFNQFPLSIDVKILLRDKDSVIIGSFLEDSTLEVAKAKPEPDGKVSENRSKWGTTYNDFIADEELAERISKAKWLTTIAKMDTYKDPNIQFVKLYSDYKIYISLNADLKLSFIKQK